MPLSQFHPLVRDWFNGRFEGPTEAQYQGWPAIAQGTHTLIAAPTGSGKTLAAFLTCIDTLVRQGLDQGLPDTTQVVYVSPLKALSNDIQKNLAAPLEEIRSLAESLGTPIPEIRTAVRTGDTKPAERQRMAKRPPHILITTPESLYLLLTSASGRESLKQVKTLILDEIHAVAGNKRGCHLSLSVERLRALCPEPITCIGLSATQKPIEEVARFLVGNENIDGQGPEPGRPKCLIVDTGHTRQLDLEIELPDLEIGPIATHAIWGETLDTITTMALSHGTTLVFVNTRRLVERVSHQLAERMGGDAVVAHHGSLSRSTRLAAEEKLKSGQVKVCVATASLELGIDIGLIDLVVQIGSPRSIGLLLQRIGRSGHTVGGTPKGRLFPLTRDELLECAALLRGVRRGNLDLLSIPGWPLDVLAQQIVAACSAEEWEEDELFRLCRRAYPYRDLPRERFDQVVDVLSNGFAPRLGRSGALLHRDSVNGLLKGRKHARITALTNGGAIPDNADYDVIADPDETFVGTVNEDFAIESLAGDIFLLGNMPWKVRRIERGKVRVEDAQGQSPSVPFWLGEAPGRTWELSQEVTELREGIAQRLEDPDGATHWLASESQTAFETARQLVAYMEEGVRVLGSVPTGNRVIAERFFDESGGMQLIIHAPFGARINRAWGMALRKRICRSFDFELQAAATDDGINLSLGPNLSFPLEDIFNHVKSETVESVLLQAVFQAPLFGTRWRWDATRSLAIQRFSGGRKVPAPLLRMRSDDLLAAVFPSQVACQDNAIPGDIEPPDHPLVFETIRDCLTEAMDLEGLKGVLRGIEAGDIQVYARDTVQPSAFSHQILNAAPYAFLDDAPLEERRARAVSLRRVLPDDPQDLGALDAKATQEESANAWPRIRDADELHEALLIVGILPPELAGGPAGAMDADLVDPKQAALWFGELEAKGRAHRATLPGDREAWVATEGLPLVRTAIPGIAIKGMDPAPVPDGTEDVAGLSREDALLTMIRGWSESSGPYTCGEMASRLGIDPADIAYAVGQLEVQGSVLRGRFRSGTGGYATGDEFCDRRILARIHRSTIGGLRREIEPVSQAVFVRFLLQWQHATPGSKLRGEGGLLDIIDLLQGFEAASGSIESDLLPSRLNDYQGSLLDGLCLGGEVVWGRVTRPRVNGQETAGRSALTRTTPITLALRESLDWLWDPPPGVDLNGETNGETDRENNLAGATGEILDLLSRRGACFLTDMISATRRLPTDVEDGLWRLAAAGRITSDGLEPLRRRIKGQSGQSNGGRRGSLAKRGRMRRPPGQGRWSLLEALDPKENPIEARARQLLLRYGIVFPELLAREPMAPRWRDLVRVLRRLEARGEIRGGRFVSGFVGEQFAFPEAVETLRGVKNREPSGEMVAVSACDPLNVVGILTPGDRVPAVLGNRVVYRDGVPVASLESGHVVDRCGADHGHFDQARAMLQISLGTQARGPLERSREESLKEAVAVS
jgi:ATP-dependent Lhr-like helicase